MEYSLDQFKPGKKLWIFGDSFASYTVARDPRKLAEEEKVKLEELEPDKEDFWFFKLARKLDCVHCIMIGIPGSSLDVMQYHFNNHINLIGKDDYLVMLHTEPSRRWFIEPLPEMTNFINFIDMKNGEIKWDWLQQVVTYKLQGEELERAKMQFQVARDYACIIARKDLEELYGHAIASYFKEYQYKGYNLINVPAYDVNNYITGDRQLEYNLDIETKGDLNMVAMSEFEMQSTIPSWIPIGTDKKVAKRWHSFMQITDGYDGRVGHLSLENHTILTDKLYNSIVNKDPLDLNSGFAEGIINKKNYQDFNLYKAQPNTGFSRISLYYAPYEITENSIDLMSSYIQKG